MKSFHLIAAAAVIVFSANLFAQADPATPAIPAIPGVTHATPAIPATPAKGIKITKITGTVNIMKDGAVIMTLKPGDAIPELTDNSVTFSIVDGTVDVEAGGKKISGATGSNFTVTSIEGQVNVALGAGTPVAVKSESGHNVILTANSEVRMVNIGDKVEITMDKGIGVITNASGGETQTVQAGQIINIPVTPILAPIIDTAAPIVPPVDEIIVPGDGLPIVPFVEPPPSVIPTQEVIEAAEVSGSTP
ncbi:MAG: DUF4148 domain-containing protein [Elusimicrobiota bacterium]|nr:DUF4148 domain-containing protein [Elusimicrobiota bacterium]